MRRSWRNWTSLQHWICIVVSTIQLPSNQGSSRMPFPPSTQRASGNSWIGRVYSRHLLALEYEAFRNQWELSPTTSADKGKKCCEKTSYVHRKSSIYRFVFIPIQFIHTAFQRTQARAALQSSARCTHSRIKVQNASRSTPRGIATPGPLNGAARERPNWPVIDTSFPWSPSVTTCRANRSPPLSSNPSAWPGCFFAKSGFKVDRITATARGSWSGGPAANPKTFSYVPAKKSSKAWKIWRITVGSFDASPPPCRMPVCTSVDARTWWVRSKAMMVVFDDKMGLLKIDSDDSGSHCTTYQ